jgi:hypothetical protein
LNPGRRGGKPATNRLSYGRPLTIVAEFSNTDSELLDKPAAIWISCYMILLQKAPVVTSYKHILKKPFDHLFPAAALLCENGCGKPNAVHL